MLLAIQLSKQENSLAVQLKNILFSVAGGSQYLKTNIRVISDYLSLLQQKTTKQLIIN